VADESNRVAEVRLAEPGVRYLVVESDERRTYEQELRQADMERTAEALRRVQKAVRAGRVKAPEKIGARAAKALSSHHGSRYFSWSLAPDGTFQFIEDPVKLAAETVREGRYILKTNDPAIGPVEILEAYKELCDVEAGYRDLKDVLAVRPVYHKSDDRVEAHIFVATLALFLKRTLQHHLNEKGIYLTGTRAFKAMQSMGVSVLDFDGTPKFLVGGGNRDAKRVVQALGIKDLNPPMPALEVRRS
jgi:transposase